MLTCGTCWIPGIIYSVTLTKEAFEMTPDESCLKHSSYSSSLNFLIPKNCYFKVCLADFNNVEQYHSPSLLKSRYLSLSKPTRAIASGKAQGFTITP